jgi:hypothetical protein
MWALIDTSAWVEYLRASGFPAHLEVRRLLHEHPASVVTTEPIVVELLAGAADEGVAKQLETLTGGLGLAPRWSTGITTSMRSPAHYPIYRCARCADPMFRTFYKGSAGRLAYPLCRTFRTGCSSGQ